MFIDFTVANKILTASHLTQHDFQITKMNRTKNYYKCFCYRCSTQTQITDDNKTIELPSVFTDTSDKK